MVQMQKDDEKVKERLSRIKHKVLVLSGKGGVGKSTVAVNLAVALAVAGRKVGLLDIDIHGPSVPKLLGVQDFPIHGTKEAISPVEIGDNLRVMSIGFLLRDSDDAVIWRGPMKFSVIKQFLGEVEWGELDYLVVDSPPGTGDEPLTIAQLIDDADGAVIVTTPQDVALIDVRKCISFCRQLSLPVIGVVENMSGFACPHCGERTEIFKSGGGKTMAEDMGVPFLGQVPVDPGIVSASDAGEPFIVKFPETETGKVFASLAAPILALESDAGRDDNRIGQPASRQSRAGDGERAADAESNGDNASMRIAIPVTKGRLSMHFGHSEQFALIDVEKGRIAGSETVDAPEHEPGLLPEWLGERKTNLIIAGGMGSRAKSLFREKGIEVLTGAPCDPPEQLVETYLEGDLVLGENTCDH
jgi:Mrp family chromosome partitioning ATPase/predicted Fe-Mo cluster-binding NifX family protein